MGNDRSATRRAEYAARINRVLDHVEKHLDGPLTLEELAKVACFSPFHFHRLFRAFTGESLYQFILRLRLEKAASQLVQQPAKSITAIALDCGFGSSASFARSFRAAYAMSASQWRDGGSKNCKAIRKDRQEPASGDGYGAPDAGASGAGHTPGSGGMQTATTTKDPVDRDREPAGDDRGLRAPHRPYAGTRRCSGRLFRQLMKWGGAARPARPGRAVPGHLPRQPGDHGAGQAAHISVCRQRATRHPREGRDRVMEIPAGKYAMARFELDPSEYGAAWAYVYGKWLPESGYQRTTRALLRAVPERSRAAPAEEAPRGDLRAGPAALIEATGRAR
jgi:AraC family transcriptional regulator